MAEQMKRQMKRQVSTELELNYLLHLPAGYTQSDTQSWPLILFLHGAGERGNNLDLLQNHGIPRAVSEMSDFPFIAVSPQCPAESWWTEQLEGLLTLVESITTEFRVDTHRIYLTGLSMGGYGTWALACRAPQQFAAIAPICGGGEAFLRAGLLKSIPAWVFHGLKDDVVPICESERIVEALESVGADVKFTVYPEAGHDSWTETYSNPELYRWLLSHRKQAD